MLHLLKLLPNEHIAAFPGRFHRLTATANFAITCKRLGIATTDLKARSYLPKRQLTGNSSLSMLLNVDSEFAKSYQNFISPFIADSLANDINSNQFQSPRITVIGSQHIENKNWRWCRECIEDDFDNYGISYYHYQHQIPGVFSCYKHSSVLCSTCSKCGFSISLIQQSYIPPNRNQCPSCNEYFSPELVDYDETIHSIEQRLKQIVSAGADFRLTDFTRHIANAIGIDPELPVTMHGNKRLRDWKSFIQSFLSTKAQKVYFRASNEKNSIMKASPLLTNPRLYKIRHSAEVLHPLIYLIALKATDHELFIKR